MSKWERVKLVDVCDFQGGSQPPKEQWINEAKDGYIRMLQIRDFTQNRNGKTEYIKISKNIKTCDDSDILIARYGASVGKILSGLSGAYNVAIMKTIPDTNKLDKKYLKLFLLSNIFQNYIANVGSRAAQAGFNKSDLQNLFIPLPPLETQKQIAKVLDNAAKLIAMRKQQLAELDNLIKSIFYDMFGDPITNEKGWDSISIVDVCTEIVDCVNKTAPIIDAISPYKMLRTTNIKNGHIDTQNVNYVDEKTYKKWTRRSVPRRGDVLLTREAPIGETGIIESDENLFLGQRIVSYRINNLIMHPLYLMYLMQSQYFQYQIRKLARGSTVKHLSVPECNLFEVYCPPLSLQTQFADTVTKIEEQKALVKKAIDETQYLIDSLMSQYFE